MDKPSAIVIGAGILGLATAYALSRKGFRVKVIERSQRAEGASVRNFGMIWPIGQPAGKQYRRAIRSRSIWREIASAAGIWHEQAGSLHLAYLEEERMVHEQALQAFEQEGRQVQWLDPERVKQKSTVACSNGLLGGLFSAEDMILDPRQAMSALPAYFSETESIRFSWGQAATGVKRHCVLKADGTTEEADLIFVCSGADTESLFPEVFARFPISKCKLQMMRLVAQPAGFRIGPAICGGLSLIHYGSFSGLPAVQRLRQRFQQELPDYLAWGIHVMVAQNGMGELTIGDSHEYGMTHDPFNKELIFRMILDYLRRMAQFPDWKVLETWHGIYPVLTDGTTEIIESPEPGIYILNGVSGAGMTISFGLAEEFVGSL